MNHPESNGVEAALLDHHFEHHSRPVNGYQHHDKNKSRPDLYIRVNSLGLSPSPRPGLPPMRVQSFRRTVRALQLDHSHSYWSVVSWIVGLLLLVVVPVLRLCFVKADPDNAQHKLVFQPLVVVVGVAISIVSFLFLSQATRRHGLRGVLFLDAAEEEVMEVRKEYDSVIERGRIQLGKLFIPIFVVYIIFRVWFYIDIQLEPLPFLTESNALSLVIIISLTTLSWIFRTTTYLYTCVLFWIVCGLQELKMKQYKDLLGKGLDPEFYYHKYVRIIRGLQATSRRFRLFLALTGFITMVGFLASMYQVVEAQRAGINMLMSGEIVVLNLVNLTGIGLCLMSASKIAHLHRRIVKAASSMHATGTFEATSFNNNPTSAKDRRLEHIEMFCHIQDAWSRRAALVNFLSSSSAGISVYGFVLDRFFVHTSIGGVLTTLWFILGRSLSS